MSEPMTRSSAGGDSRYAICVGGFYADLAQRLVRGAREEFAAAGVGEDRIDVIEIPDAANAELG